MAEVLLHEAKYPVGCVPSRGSAPTCLLGGSVFLEKRSNKQSSKQALRIAQETVSAEVPIILQCEKCLVVGDSISRAGELLMGGEK